VDNVDKTVHNLVFAYDQMWIKLWMKNNVSDIALLCHLLYILMSFVPMMVPPGAVWLSVHRNKAKRFEIP
jgi:hypothetical protein